MWETESCALETHLTYENIVAKGEKMHVPRYILILTEKSGNKYNVCVIILQKYVNNMRKFPQCQLKR